MFNRLIKYRQLVTAFFILVPFIFCFYYCELGDFSNSQGKSASPDFCTIIKSVNLENGKSASNGLCNLKVEKYFIPPSIGEIITKNFSINILDAELFHPPNNSTQIYLYNCTFLI